MLTLLYTPVGAYCDLFCACFNQGESDKRRRVILCAKMEVHNEKKKKEIFLYCLVIKMIILVAMVMALATGLAR